MKKSFLALAIVAMLSAMMPTSTDAQILMGRRGVTNMIPRGKSDNGSKDNGGSPIARSTQRKQSNVFYVCAETGSGRAPGTIDKPFKDIQKAINNAENGDIILVAEGNYLGSMDQGYLEIKKYLTIQGGYSSDFSQWDPIKYKTYIQPGPECTGTNGNYGLIDLDVTGDPRGLVIIDGIGFDKGEENLYCANNPADEATGSPEGCLSGRMIKVGESPKGPKIGGADINKALMFGKVEGECIVRNCTFVNGNNFAMQVSCAGGHIEVYNNVFCANVMSALDGRGMKNDQNLCSIDFHHNTVLFTWTRTKVLEDMGQGFRFMPGYGVAECHDNIFGCNILGAVERTHYDSDKQKEAARQTVLTNNCFFMNHADLILPSGGGKWLFVRAKDLEDVDEKFLTVVEGNRELGNEEKFIQAIDQSYLKGFAGLKVISSQKYDPNSGANQFNRAFGLNQQGTEIVRPSMYANKYPFFKAYDLYGAVAGCGAQIPQQED